MISILVTNKCNMACKYCYLGSKDAKDEKEKRLIDIKFAKKAIQDYFAVQARPAVRFFADGEPTLGFEVIRELHDYIPFFIVCKRQGAHPAALSS